MKTVNYLVCTESCEKSLNNWMKSSNLNRIIHSFSRSQVVSKELTGVISELCAEATSHLGASTTELEKKKALLIVCNHFLTQIENCLPYDCNVFSFDIEKVLSVIENEPLFKDGKIQVRLVSDTIQAELHHLSRTSARKNYELIEKICSHEMDKERATNEIVKIEIEGVHPSMSRIQLNFKLLIQRIFKKCKNMLYKWNVIEDNWNVYINRSDDLNPLSMNWERVIPPNHRYQLADPFIYSIGEKVFLLAEMFSKSEPLGRLVQFEILEDHVVFLGEITDGSSHYSFPFIFQFEHKTFMVPESLDSEALELWELNESDNSFSKKSSNLPRIKTVDSIILNQGLIWILITNEILYDSSNSSDYFSVYWTDNPIVGTWKKLNKNYNFAGSARNGGLSRINGQNFRTRQIHEVNRYGARFLVSKIFMDDEYNLAEVPVLASDSIKLRNKISSHHFSVSDGYSVMDAQIRSHFPIIRRIFKLKKRISRASK
jgi:hypothetical protein